MIKKFFFSIFFLSLPLLGYGESFIPSLKEGTIVINNRILAKVNGKPLSVIDVMKKMDVLFYKQFPEYTMSNEARYYFYNANWKQVYTELLSKQLIVADAEEVKIQVNNGDVRQEMENLFGPNIISNLDKIGMTYEEAFKIVQGDLLIRRMIGARVHAKAIRLVTPTRVRDSYENYMQNPENIQPSQWQYYVISIRDEDSALASEAASSIYHLLSTGQADLNTFQERMQNQNILSNTTIINVSELLKHQEKEMSEVYKATILSLPENTYSLPILQKSRAKNTVVYRIFFLQKKNEEGFLSFRDMEPKIRDQLIDEEIDKETDVYLTKLKQHFDVLEMFQSEDEMESFKPFALSN